MNEYLKIELRSVIVGGGKKGQSKHSGKEGEMRKERVRGQEQVSSPKRSPTGGNEGLPGPPWILVEPSCTGVTSSCQASSLRASAGEGEQAALEQRPMDMQLARELAQSRGRGQRGSLG